MGATTFVALLLVILGGCSGRLNQAGKWHDAPIDKETGRVVMLWLTCPDDSVPPGKGKPDGVRPEVLENDYAVLVLWQWAGKEQDFYLFDSKKRRYFHTDDLECFLIALRQLPEGAVVEQVQKCSAQFDYRMPEERREKIAQVLRERSISEPEEQFTRCTCGATGIKFLE